MLLLLILIISLAFNAISAGIFLALWLRRRQAQRRLYIASTNRPSRTKAVNDRSQRTRK